MAQAMASASSCTLPLRVFQRLPDHGLERVLSFELIPRLLQHDLDRPDLPPALPNPLLHMLLQLLANLAPYLSALPLALPLGLGQEGLVREGNAEEMAPRLLVLARFPTRPGRPCLASLLEYMESPRRDVVAVFPSCSTSSPFRRPFAS